MLSWFLWIIPLRWGVLISLFCVFSNNFAHILTNIKKFERILLTSNDKIWYRAQKRWKIPELYQKRNLYKILTIQMQCSKECYRFCAFQTIWLIFWLISRNKNKTNIIPQITKTMTKSVVQFKCVETNLTLKLSKCNSYQILALKMQCGIHCNRLGVFSNNFTSFWQTSRNMNNYGFILLFPETMTKSVIKFKCEEKPR